MPKPTKHKPEITARYTRDTRPPYKCKDCDYMTRNLTGLKMHWQRRHGGCDPNLPNLRNGTAKLDEAKPRKLPKRLSLDTGGVNYCPGCGCNLAAVRLALTMSHP